MMAVADTGTEIEIAEPTGVVKRKRGGVSPKSLDRAAQELNLIRVDAKGLLNIATVGRFLHRVGMLHYGNGRLLASAAMIAEAADRCAELAKKTDIDEETRQGYLNLQLKFIQALDHNVDLHLTLNQAPLNEGNRGGNAAPMPSKPFLPGAQISPINIQINAGVASVSTQPKEEPCPSQS